MGSRTASGIFPALRLLISAFFTEIFFQISVVILNSIFQYQIFKFDIDIQIISLDFW